MYIYIYMDVLSEIYFIIISVYRHYINSSVNALITSSSSISTTRQDVETAEAAATAPTSRVCECACVRGA